MVIKLLNSGRWISLDLLEKIVDIFERKSKENIKKYRKEWDLYIDEHVGEVMNWEEVKNMKERLQEQEITIAACTFMREIINNACESGGIYKN